MRWPFPFFKSHPVRAILDTLAVGLVLWFALVLLQPLFSSLIWRLGICLGIGLICVIFFSFRLQLPGGSRRRQMLFEASVGSMLGLLLSCVELAILLVLLRGASLNALWRGGSRPLLTALIALLLNVAVFFALRMGIRLWLFWNRLRQRQLLWALTHAHVMILLLGAGLLLVVLEAVVIYNSPDVFLVVSTTLGLIILSLIALLVVLPLSALFSYLVMRRTTQRLQTLVAATSALRQGNYAIRVPVQGGDEVAQLQADFNGMAADLEQVVQELQGERDRVAALLQARREMIATVSHELRTPVATLRGYLETILLRWGEPSSTTFHHDLQVMEHEVIHLQFLVEDLFTLARTDVSQLALQREPTDIGIIVQRVVETMAPLAWRTSKIEMVSEVPSALPPALVDVNRLEQVIQNLLHNAVRHTAPGGIVALMVAVETEAIALQVKDTGEGIAAEDLPHIWERFYRRENARTHMVGGAGLGLALVKEWIEEMDGTVAVESVVGEGSCFRIHLPKAAC
jgi:signal transduction histidine kinase